MYLIERKKVKQKRAAVVAKKQRFEVQRRRNRSKKIDWARRLSSAKYRNARGIGWLVFPLTTPRGCLQFLEKEGRKPIDLITAQDRFLPAIDSESECKENSLLACEIFITPHSARF